MLPRTTGLRVQAALDYYENLRAARIFNHTKTDPRSINIDIDNFAQNFDLILSSILDHFSPFIANDIDRITSLALVKKRMKVFDINSPSSSLYRWAVLSVREPESHLKLSSGDLVRQIETDSKILSLYQEISGLYNL
jgi:hypothetical protein